MGRLYDLHVQKLNDLIAKITVIGKSISETVQGKGIVDAGKIIGKAIYPESRSDIEKLGKGIKDGFFTHQSQFDSDLCGLISELADLIDTLPTGRRIGELRVGRKKELIKEVGRKAGIKNFMARYSGILSFTSELRAEIMSLNIVWEPKTQLITKGRQLKGLVELENIFSKMTKDYVKICDPYCSHETLAVLEATPSNLPISLYTEHIDSEEKFKGFLQKLRDRGYKIEVIALAKGVAPHDRYIATLGKAWQIGSSLKDIGKKTGTIVEIDDNIQIDHIMNTLENDKSVGTRRL